MIKNNKVFWCTSCVVMSTRPRISFDEKGRCSACQWAEKKKKINWQDRRKKLEKLLDKHRNFLLYTTDAADDRIRV